MTPSQFIHRNIITELISQGASPYNAEQAATFALIEHKRRADMGKDAFGELLRIAGTMASKHDPSFRYVHPKR